MKTIQVDRTVVGNHVVRIVFNDFEDSWSKYVIIPRELAVKHVRKIRAQYHKENGGRTPWCRSAWSCQAIHVALDFLTTVHYNGPGRSFAHAPVRISSSRRYVVFYQSGGMDI